jgi:WD40 repeat protein
VHCLGLPLRRPRSLAGHASSVISVATLGPARALTASCDGVLRVWDIEDGVCLRTLDLGEQIRDVAAPAYGHPGMDGRVVVACRSGVYAVHLGKSSLSVPLRLPLCKEPGPVRVACDQSGMLVCGIRDNLLYVCKRSCQDSECTNAGMKDLTDDDEDVLMSSSGAMGLPVIHCVRHSRNLTSVAVSSDGSLIAVGCDSGEIFVFRELESRLRKVDPDTVVMNSKLAPARLHWHAGAVSALSFSGGANILLSGGAEAVLVVWKMSRVEFGDRSFRPRLGGGIWGIAVSPDDTKFAVTCADNAVRVLSSFSMSVEAAFQGLSVPATECTGSGVSRRKGRDLVLSNLAGLRIVPDPGSEGCVLISKVGPAVQVYNVLRGEHVGFLPIVPKNIVHVAAKGSESLSVPRQPNVEFACMNRNADLMATLDSQDLFEDSTVESQMTRTEVLRFWHRNEKEGRFDIVARVDRPHGHSSRVRAIEFHPSLPVLATASQSGDFKLWRMASTGVDVRPLTWRCEAAAEHRGLPCGSLAFSSDGSLLAVAIANTISLWHLQQLHVGGTNENKIDSVQGAFSDGSVVEGSPRSLDVQSLHTFVHPPADEHIRDVKFMGDVDPFIVAITQHGVYVWHVLGQCIWWTIRLCTLDKPISIDFDSNRFAVAIELPISEHRLAATAVGKPSSKIGDVWDEAGTLKNSLNSASHEINGLDEEGAPVGRSVGSGNTESVNGSRKTRKRNKKWAKRDSDSRLMDVDVQRIKSVNVVEGESPSNGTIKSVAHRRKSEAKGSTAFEPSPSCTSLPGIQVQKKGMLPADISGDPVSGTALVDEELKKGKRSSLSAGEMDTGLVIFDVSSPVPVCVHLVRNQAKLLAATFVKAPRSYFATESCPLVYIDGNLDVHIIADNASADVGSQVVVDTQSGHIGTGNDGTHRLDHLLGADWRERIKLPNRSWEADSSNVTALASDGDLSIGRHMSAKDVCLGTERVVATIAEILAGPTHTLAPISVSGPELIGRLMSSPKLPRPVRLDMERCDQSVETQRGSEFKDVDVGGIEVDQGGVIIDASGWHWEPTSQAANRGAMAVDKKCNSRLLRFTTFFQNMDSVANPTKVESL